MAASSTTTTSTSTGTGRPRTSSFHDIDHHQASGILGDVLREANIYLGGSSVGTGLKKAALHYLEDRIAKQPAPAFMSLPGAQARLTADLNDSAMHLLNEESFYVLDLGMVASQVYQWRRFFPRIEPFYAVKCNPDPVIVKTLAVLGCNFDCASRAEIQLVQEACTDIPRSPDIIYANPCKARAHLLEAVCKGVTMVTFDNLNEIVKCASVSKDIKLVLRIITDDRGSQCRFSTKFGAPQTKWRSLLAAAQHYGLDVVGVSFHVGSGCRDASKYELALKDARDIFDFAKRDFGMNMTLLDIGGGFPGETHSLWNPKEGIDPRKAVIAAAAKSAEEALEGIIDGTIEEEEDTLEGKDEEASNSSKDGNEDSNENDHFMFFTEIAKVVAPLVDELFPPEEGVRVIAEPGRYFVAAAATLCCSVVAARDNALDTCGVGGNGSGTGLAAHDSNGHSATAVDDTAAAKALDDMTREDEQNMIHRRGRSSAVDTGDATTNIISKGSADSADVEKSNTKNLFNSIQQELEDYSKMIASQQLVQQEFDVYNDTLDLYTEGYATAIDLLGPPEPDQIDKVHHTAEGVASSLLVPSAINKQRSFDSGASEEEKAQHQTNSNILSSLGGAGEAAVSGFVKQAVVDSSNEIGQDDYSYYINDGVYGAFNNLMFDHAHVRPRVLIRQHDDNTTATPPAPQRNLYASTVFGPTCDSIDVISRSVLLPKLAIGDWMYFQNMGAYTMAAASSFNGFTPSETFYVCSVQPVFFERIIKGPETVGADITNADAGIEKHTVSSSSPVTVVKSAEEHPEYCDASDEKKADE